MTTKEASWLGKLTASGKRVKIKYNDIMCTNIIDSDLRKEHTYTSEEHFANPFRGIYTWYDNNLQPRHSICVRELNNENHIYQCNIERLELVKDEVAHNENS